MKILASFLCFLFLGLLVLLATVNLEPFLTLKALNLEDTAAPKDPKGESQTAVNGSPLPPDARNVISNEPVLSRITTHQLIVTEKRETDKLAFMTNKEQAPLLHPGDNAAMSDSLLPGKQ